MDLNKTKMPLLAYLTEKVSIARWTIIATVVVLVAIVIFLVGCAQLQVEPPTVVPTIVPTTTPTMVLSPTSTATPVSPTETPAPTATHTTIPAESAEGWQRYTDSEFGISFDYPASWTVGESINPLDDYRALEVSDPELGRILITKEDNPEQLSPRQWFQSNRKRYHPDLISEIAEPEIQGNPSLIIGQPDTCLTVPAIIAIVSHADAIFVISHSEIGSRSAAFELGRLLETLSFDEQPSVTTSISASYLQFPEAPANVPCPE